MSIILMGTLNVVIIKLSYSRLLLNTFPKGPEAPTDRDVHDLDSASSAIPIDIIDLWV